MVKTPGDPLVFYSIARFLVAFHLQFLGRYFFFLIIFLFATSLLVVHSELTISWRHNCSFNISINVKEIFCSNIFKYNPIKW